MEVRRVTGHIIKRALLQVAGIILFLLASGENSFAQDPLKIYTIKDGKMFVWLSKDLPVPELDQFISQYDLQHLSLKRFINTGNDDSIRLAGWRVELNNTRSFAISKPLLSSGDLIDPSGRIVFTGPEPPPDERFPSVSNNLKFGFNQFKDKKSFALIDSTVIFFMKGNLSARKVLLSGSFNDWDPEGLAMTKTDSGWIVPVKLTPGKYWYKFIVDGNWTVDNDNRLRENDGTGNINSVFYYTNTVFRLKDNQKARKVFVAGSFNNWNEKELAMHKIPGGWELPLYLAGGTHTYRFIVDRNWMADPDNPQRFPNEHNDFNSVISVGKPYVFKLDGYPEARNVILSGSFNGWRDNELLMVKTATGWAFPYVLGAGNYEYKFIVDGKSIPDPSNPSHISNSTTSYLVLHPNYTFRLKGFETAATVFLAGDFNDWSPNSLGMKKENDEWVFRVHLSPGKHLYKFVVDGNWIIDPANKLWEQNEQQTGNSVLWIDND